jgi:hypothetical protein
VLFWIQNRATFLPLVPLHCRLGAFGILACAAINSRRSWPFSACDGCVQLSLAKQKQEDIKTGRSMSVRRRRLVLGGWFVANNKRTVLTFWVRSSFRSRATEESSTCWLMATKARSYEDDSSSTPEDLRNPAGCSMPPIVAPACSSSTTSICCCCWMSGKMTRHEQGKPARGAGGEEL